MATDTDTQELQSVTPRPRTTAKPCRAQDRSNDSAEDPAVAQATHHGLEAPSVSLHELGALMLITKLSIPAELLHILGYVVMCCQPMIP